MTRTSDELARRLQRFGEDLAERFGLINSRVGFPELKLPRRGEYESTVTIPTHVLEWFVAVADQTGTVVWEDWADYFGDAPDTLDELEMIHIANDVSAEMRHIENYVSAWCSADDVRLAEVQPSPSRFTRWLTKETAPGLRVAMEWRHDGVWSPVEMIIEHPTDP